ncbi:MAG: hypothetical protein V2J62_08500 [candidate division KSB1 bacterium]|jgi:hypothetical protein|nr:hypothetical protein [candidate division KSB1 bacterium]
MKRVRTVTHRGTEIVIIDFSSMKPGPELQVVIEQGRVAIHEHELNSVLTLVDVSESEFDAEMIEALRVFARENKPFVKASAVVGSTGIYDMAREAIQKTSGRHFVPFSNRERALDWLAKQTE